MLMIVNVNKKIIFIFLLNTIHLFPLDQGSILSKIFQNIRIPASDYFSQYCELFILKIFAEFKIIITMW